MAATTTTYVDETVTNPDGSTTTTKKAVVTSGGGYKTQYTAAKTDEELDYLVGEEGLKDLLWYRMEEDAKKNGTTIDEYVTIEQYNEAKDELRRYKLRPCYYDIEGWIDPEGVETVECAETQLKFTYDEMVEYKTDHSDKPDKWTELEWKAAWIKKEKEAGKTAKISDPGDPTPLATNKINSAPPGSSQRIAAENAHGTLNNTASNNGTGLDNLTRESYKDTKRLVKSSEKLSEEVKQPLPDAKNIVGEEEGKPVSNLQSHVPVITNAVKPVSDAIGSHADTSSSISKSPSGPDQPMPQAAAALVSNISPQISNEITGSVKSIKMDEMQHLPSKMMGSIRQLATAGDAMLAVPFEIASDVYNGLLELMDEMSNLIDGVMASLTNFAIGVAGGLVDALFPPALLEGILAPIMAIAGELGDLGQMLGGFSAISSITNAIGGIAGSLASALGDPAKLAAALAGGANIAGIIGGMAGKSAGCGAAIGLGGALGGGIAGAIQGATSVGGGIAGAVGGALGGGVAGALQGATAALGGVIGGIPDFPNLKGGMGNIGAVLAGGGGISGTIGKLTANLSNPGQLIAGILPPELSQAMGMLDKIPGLGMVGNQGYSIGSAFDSLTDNSFGKCMKQYACHAGIVSPLFNKQHDTKGGYAQEENVTGAFENMPFGNGAQGNKGVTMLGPGATASQRMFPGGYALLEQNYSAEAESIERSKSSTGLQELERGNAAAGGMSQAEVDAYIAETNPAASKQIAAMKAESAATQAKYKAHIAAAGGL